ncbi:MAG TPA: glycosyltransferase family 4 protein [Vicinamibacterales bacterium]|nr:glycosyltransferase family 4 protein [Vicinamibacterales bacterium]
MRILYLADIRFPLERANGIQSMQTCYALAARGHRVTMIVRPDTASPARDPFAFYGLPASRDLSVERAPVSGSATMRRVGYLTFAAGRALGRARQDVVFTRDLGVASALLRVPAAFRPPIVFEAHGVASLVSRALPTLVSTASPPSDAKLRRLDRRDARVWHAADGYVTITSGLAGELTRRFGPRGRLAIVPDGVRLDAAPPSVPERSGPLTIAYAGHLYPWKGPDLVVEAVAELPGVRAVIVGGLDAEPDLARLRQHAAERGVADRVAFTGAVPPPEVAARLRAADVLVLPNPASAISTGFTSPLKLFEYMAAGRPIVAADLPSIREVLQPDVNAVLVPPGDARAIAAGVRRLADDRTLAERLAARALSDVSQYSWAARAQRLEDLLRQLVPTA